MEAFYQFGAFADLGYGGAEGDEFAALEEVFAGELDVFVGGWGVDYDVGEEWRGGGLRWCVD